MISLLLLSNLLHNTAAATGYEVIVHNAVELSLFSNIVNEEMNYKGTTVLLDSDIDFAGTTFEPIGNGTSNYFAGVFDGQGHTISNLKIVSSSDYIGLFGYSEGLTIQNVILDSTCSITKTGVDGYAVAGGILGSCYAAEGNCNVLNSVSMTNVTYNGIATGNYGSVNLGGIVGYLDVSRYDVTMRNCVNYGTITHAGYIGKTYIGGIVGYIDSIKIQNCLNYGTLVHSGKSDYLAMGGIAGEIRYKGNLDNCVSAGSIVSNDNSQTVYVGAIVGDIILYGKLCNCYWDEKIGYDPCEHRPSSSPMSDISSFNDEFVLDESVSIGNFNATFLIDALNAGSEYYTERYYSHWFLNKNKNNIKFTVNSKKIISLDSPVILLPNIAILNKRWFDGWYTDSDCTVLLTDFENSTITELYGTYDDSVKNYTITFDTRGGPSIDPITHSAGSIVRLPSNPSKDGYMVIYWETEAGYRVSWNYVMPAYDITLYAVWMSLHITTPEKLIELSTAVNSESVGFIGKTVYLDSDIEFTDELSVKFNPIGKYMNSDNGVKYFAGTFDGQGHVIKNLTLYASGFAGLFGYSLGVTIRNVVMDSSCTYKDTFTSSPEYHEVGSILGYCYAESAPCIIENCVNRMNIKYTLTSKSVNIGGIVGEIRGYDFASESHVKNCVNYGSITITGDKVFQTIYAGGIVGEIYYVSVSDCTNYGDLAFNGTVTYSAPRLNGIAGFSYDATINNCKNYGTITNVSDSNAGVIARYVFIGIALVAIAVGLVFLFCSFE